MLAPSLSLIYSLFAMAIPTFATPAPAPSSSQRRDLHARRRFFQVEANALTYFIDHDSALPP